MRPIALWWCAATLLAAAPPPIIDRELFFDDPEIAGAQISPDGKYIAFLKPHQGTRNIWVKRTAEPFSAAQVVTSETKRPIPAYFWSRDGRYLLYAQDAAGDENYNVYAADPAHPGAARNLTDAKAVQAALYAVPKSDPDILYVGLNDRDKAWHDLYRVRISTGERTLLRKNEDRVTAWVFDNRDQLRLATRSAVNGDTEVLRVDADKLTRIYSCNVFESCAPVKFEKDNRRVYFITNKGAIDLIALTLLDPATGDTSPVESDPLKRVDISRPLFSDLTDELLATTYQDDRRRIYWKNKSFEADYKLLQKKLPGKEVNFGSRTRDEQLFLVSAASDTDPGSTYLFDRKTKQLSLQYRIRERIPREQLAEMQAIRYKSSDGLEIPAYLTLPKGVPANNLPLIAVPHGGPWGRDTWGYNSLHQFLANRGYAVLSPNFRASTGYGKKFLDAGNGEWGQKMQDDITWGIKHLIAKGLADPKRVGIMGGSYGGYATLAGVAFTPDVYAAAVDIVGPSNLITLLGSIPPYWEQIRTLFHKRMGDPNTPEGKAQLMRQSPLTSADKIRTPLLVIQGANDPRVNKAEADQIVIALRDRGFPVEYLVAPDEGHGFARPVNSMAMYASAEKFLAKHLGGRFQEGGKPEVTQRLKEITVDPKTVVLAKKLDLTSSTAARPAAALVPGTYVYQVNIAMGERKMEMKQTTVIAEESGGWRVSETTATPMGDASDSGLLDKQTLALVERTVKQGPANIGFKVKDGKIAGELTMNGQTKPIALDLDGPLLGDGPAAGFVVAALPLAPGYTTTLRTFDLMRQKVTPLQLKVVGEESVTVAAGTFDAYKASLLSEDGSEKATLWIAKDSRKPLKTTAVMKEMGGAKMTAELTK